MAPEGALEFSVGAVALAHEPVVAQDARRRVENGPPTDHDSEERGAEPAARRGPLDRALDRREVSVEPVAPHLSMRAATGASSPSPAYIESW